MRTTTVKLLHPAHNGIKNHSSNKKQALKKLSFKKIRNGYKRSLLAVKHKPLVSAGAALAAVSTLSGLYIWYRLRK